MAAEVQTGASSRRSFLEQIGKTAGVAAMYDAMIAMGLLHTPAAFAQQDLDVLPAGAGKSVTILGAGMSGLMVAYELQKRGYRCVILELLDRPGGRNFTARRGSKVVEDTGPQGRTEQVCDFDAGLYMNMGPARLLFHHKRAMHYCRELAVPLEIYVMSNMANLYQSPRSFGGQAMPRFRLANDVNYHVADLLSKAIDQGALRRELPSGEMRAALQKMLVQFGGTGQSATVGADTPRTLCADPMTVQAMCKANPTLALQDILKSDLWNNRFFQPFEGDWEPSLFQPVGGMDKFVDGFTKHVGHLIRYGAKVQSIENTAAGARVSYLDLYTRQNIVIDTDYVFSAIPLGKLTSLRHNFSAEYANAIAKAKPGPLYKLAWQANERFWESEKYNIFGGISYIEAPLTQMWYPSNDYYSQKGVLPGVYCYDDQAVAYGRMTLADRIRAARSDSIKLHPEMASEALLPSNKAVSIAWHQAEGQTGGYTAWDHSDRITEAAYQRLLKPEGRFFAIGDQLSFLPGWQEGAFMSAENAMRLALVH